MELKQLEAIIRLCRKTGVSTISIEGVTLTLSPEAPQSPYKKRTAKAPRDPFEQAMAEAKDAATKAKLKYMSEQHKQQEDLTDPSGAPDPLAMLMWSAGGGDGAN